MARLRTLCPGEFINLGETALTADAYSDEVRLTSDGSTAPTLLLARLQGDNVTGAGDEIQTLTVGGSGLTSFTITWEGQTTGSLDADASAAEVQAALEALSNIGPGEALVTGDDGGPWTVQFTGALGDQNQDAMTTTPTGGTGVVTVATVTGGGTGTLDVIIEGSFDQASWWTLATFTQATTTAVAENEVAGPAVLPPFIRGSFNVGGTNPSYTFDLFVGLA
jgi:hypothetical protein